MKPDSDAINSLDWAKGDGLLPAIVQHAGNGRVLMLGFVNRAALSETLKCGYAVFYSRSRKRLWKKGETSGNTLAIQSVDADCDRDTLLFRARPAGPTCHDGSVSCFGDAAPFLQQLESVVAGRAQSQPGDSYTARLLNEGVSATARKVGEEAIEVALAAVGESDQRVASEAADLLFHLIVLLQQRGLTLDDAVEELQRRHEANG